ERNLLKGPFGGPSTCMRAALNGFTTIAAQSKAVERRRRRATGLQRNLRHARRAASARPLSKLAARCFSGRHGGQRNAVHVQARSAFGSNEALAVDWRRRRARRVPTFRSPGRAR